MTPSPSKKPPTLATIAEAVGVSRMTVSNAFNRPDQLSPALRERILAVAAELGYGGPDPVARTLSRGETGAVGLVVDYPLTLALTDPATLGLLLGVAAECEQRGLGLSLVPRLAGRDAALVRTALVDGFVLYSVMPGDPRLRAVRARRLPYVLVDHEPAPGVAVVNIDDWGATRAVAEHLTGLGHRRVAVVLGWDNPAATAGEIAPAYHVYRERTGGWREGFVAAGVDWDGAPVGSGPGFDRATGRIAGLSLLERAAGERPTAVVTFSDLLALGVIDAAAERGVAVPDELSVVGFDDVPAAALATPPLTTVRQPHAGKGAAAIRALLDGGEPGTVLLPTELIVRSSTAPPR